LARLLLSTWSLLGPTFPTKGNFIGGGHVKICKGPSFFDQCCPSLRVIVFRRSFVEKRSRAFWEKGELIPKL
jgi:hypothetical protein